ncbi:MAG: aldehyde dehydrogenase family protein [Akkermansiaceae bacterium]|nr:aldehyde dehydrogenase family protein [Akkermansiaceae bacterium]
MEFTEHIASQRAFFLSGGTRSAEFRRAQLGRLLDAIEKHEEALLAALHADLRKPPTEAYASEIGFVLGEIRHALRHLDRWVKPQSRRCPFITWPSKAAIHPEPMGVALILGPWNYPFQVLISPLVGAIAAGNCAILKPSELAPRTADLVCRIIGETFDAQYITAIPGDHTTAEALLRGKFDTIFFTGSTRTGRSVMTAAAANLTPVTLELGGKSPCIVAADAPIETTARRIVWGKFMNAGQTCVAPDHVLVDARVHDALIDALKKSIAAFYGPDPQKSADYGRIVNRRHFDRLTAYLTEADVAAGGRHDAEDLFIEPTILINPKDGAALLEEEIFGPILPVIAFQNIDQVIADLNRGPAPLALYLFSNDAALQEKVVRGTRSGGVCINDTISHILARDLPFGGLGESGMGQYHGKASFDAFTHRRAVMKRSTAFDPNFRYPPPALALPALKRMLRIFGAG